MANTKVALYRRVKTDEGWKHFPAAYAANGRVKANCSIVAGEEVNHGEGYYELRYYIGSRLVYERLYVRSASDAATARDRKAGQLGVRRDARELGVQIVEDPTRPTLKASGAAYIEDAEQRQALEAAEVAKLVIDEFLLLVPDRTYVDEITRKDVFTFHKALRKRGLAERTVSNKHARLISWLKFGGINPIVLPPQPKYEESLPTIYTSEQSQALLKAAAPYNRMLTLLALKCGLREQELRHLEFSDLNLEESTLRVQSKPRWNFKVKAWEQRDIPVPSDLMVELSKWKIARVGQTLVLGTRNTTPNGKLLQSLKRQVKSAGLNCNNCDACIARKECEDWTLHKFRRTYITTLLRSGVDLRTVQAFAGHKDLASTMRYLRPASGAESQAKVNAVRW